MKGPLETGLHRMEQGRQGERDGQTEGGMTKIRGQNPSWCETDKRCWRNRRKRES